MPTVVRHYESTTPQWVTTQNSVSANTLNTDPFVWHVASTSAALPSMDNSTKRHSPWAQFAATCMYFGAELIAAREAKGIDADVPIGLIQSAIGGSQIESWMDNKYLHFGIDSVHFSTRSGLLPCRSQVGLSALSRIVFIIC